VVLAVALAAIARLLTLGDPAPKPAPDGTPFATVVPTWSGPAPVDISGALADGGAYTPRLYLSADTSVGVVTSADGTVRVLLNGPGGQAVELRRLPPDDRGRIDGFAYAGDALVWMETVVRAGASVTSLWRTTWSTAVRPVQVTTNTGTAMFPGLASDVIVQDGRIYWTARAAGGTEVRSVALTGGQVTTKRVAGEYRLAGWPWAVSIAGGRGAPVTMLDLTTDAATEVATGVDDVPVCSPAWCRMTVAGDAGLVGIDLVRPDGSDRRRIAGSEATPIIADATLLDRYVPLTTDRGSGGVGLSLYDLTTGRTDLVTAQAANVQGRDGVLWWSSGAGEALVWHAVDLRAIT
jgi:hypothetical protein